MTHRMPYGTWPSPISPEDTVSASGRFGTVWADGNETWWSESRPNEGGRTQIVYRNSDGETSDLLPDDFSARSRVHEYGGGAWWVAQRTVYFVNGQDQRIYQIAAGRSPTPLTPVAPSDESYRYADGRITPDGAGIVCVREHHSDGRVDNALVYLPVDGSSIEHPDRVRVLVAGNDFYSSPRVSPDGTALAWITWSHPNMPWDDTELWVASLDQQGVSVTDERQLGGAGVAFQQPEWSPHGDLFVIADDTDWWNVYRLSSLDSDAERQLVFEVSAEVALPAWNFDRARYVVGDGDDRNSIVHLTYSDGGRAHLVSVVVDTAGTVTSTNDTPLEGYTSLEPLRATSGRLVAGAGSVSCARSVIEVDPAAHDVTVLHAGNDFGLEVVSVAEPVTFASSDGRTAYGWYLPPAGVDAAGDRLEGAVGETPPMIVTVHGGPTAGVDPEFSITSQFWTSRGFAILMVDYAGSTGYGRSYRHSLDGLWGIADVEDVASGARAMAELGKADAKRTVIVGGSAGGFTVMMALAVTDAFAAGVTRYGVSDLAALARDTHKFESRYLDRLIGSWPEAAETYAARSPINHLDALDRPMLVLQGTEDRVVPPSQAEMVVAALAARDLPHAYILFEGEDHGFRKAESMLQALRAEYAFYAALFDLDVADDIAPLDLYEHRA